MPSADSPLRPVAPHVHSHGHDAPAIRPPLTLLSSGLGYRLGTAAALTALLWAVVLWALA
jgi:hypothetical protein